MIIKIIFLLLFIGVIIFSPILLPNNPFILAYVNLFLGFAFALLASRIRKAEDVKNAKKILISEIAHNIKELENILDVLSKQENELINITYKDYPAGLGIDRELGNAMIICFSKQEIPQFAFERWEKTNQDILLGVDEATYSKIQTFYTNLKKIIKLHNKALEESTNDNIEGKDEFWVKCKTNITQTVDLSQTIMQLSSAS